MALEHVKKTNTAVDSVDLDEGIERDGTSGKCFLLELSAELRNQIYEHTLVQGDRISIHTPSDLKEPALLRTCRQIRSEARPIYWYQNSFFLYVVDCNPKILKAFLKAIKDFGKRTWPSALLRIRGSPNWANLMVWCEQVHKRRLARLKYDANEWSKVISAATLLAPRFEGRP